MSMTPEQCVAQATKDVELIKLGILNLETVLVAHRTTPMTLYENKVYTKKASALVEKLDGAQEKLIYYGELEHYNAYNSNFITLSGRIVATLDALNTIFLAFPQPAPTSASTTTASSHTGSPRLPKLDLPKFGGRITDWISFRDLFKNTVHLSISLAPSQKLTYLKSLLVDEASKLVTSLAITDANYDIAWKTLEVRYNNNRELLFSILKNLEKIQHLHSPNGFGLRSMIDNIKMNLQAARQLGRATEYWDDLILYQIYNKIDQKTRQLWEQSLPTNDIPALQNLLDFLETRARSLIASAQPKKVDKPKKVLHQQVLAQEVQNKQWKPKCIHCNGEHQIYFCAKFKDLAVNNRREIAREKALCFNCLKQNHSASSCPSKFTCKTCNKKHNTLLHFVGESEVPQGSVTLHSQETFEIMQIPTALHEDRAMAVQGHSQIFLATALIRIQGHLNKTKVIRALLDPGSSASFITSNIAKLMKLKQNSEPIKVTGLGSNHVASIKHSTLLQFGCHQEMNFPYEVNTYVVPVITGRLPTQPCELIKEFSNLNLADPYYYKQENVDILLGSDIYYDLLEIGILNCREGPTAIKTKLGWIIGGAFLNQERNATIFMSLTLENSLQKFWELENIEGKHDGFSQDEQLAEEHFKSNYKRGENGIEVRIPCKDITIGASREIALKRLIYLEKRLNKNESHKQEYFKFMDEYENLNHMEQISEQELLHPKNPVCYIPHHFIQKESSTTTKFRVVFDASAKTSNGISLNETMIIGPTIQDTLATILMRFRIHPIAFSADINKMYRQIKVSKEDADLQRILWRKSPSEPVKDYRLLTVTYGTASAPYLATRALQQLGIDEEINFPLASQIVQNDFYVDDLLSGAENEQQAIQYYKEISDLMTSGNLELRKWSSNSSKLLQIIPETQRELKTLTEIEDDQAIKALGIVWNTSKDQFQFIVSDLQRESTNLLTKRIILSEISRLFDPLGWFAPVIILAKIQMQEIWKLKELGWDSAVPIEIADLWINLRKTLIQLANVNIPRHALVLQPIRIRLVGFCDASERAYATAIYLVSSNHNLVKSELIASKTRVSPIKVISLPRLELCGAVLLSELMLAVQKSLKINIDELYAYTDSTITLAWIKSSSHQWKTFVANRISKIQEKIPDAFWRHVPGIENPADCASRGIFPNELVSHPLWWNGPHWITEEIMPYDNVEIPSHELELKRTNVPVLQTTTTNEDDSLLHKYSSWTKVQHITSWSFRFINNCKAKVSNTPIQSGPLQTAELQNARILWIKKAQEDVYCREINALTNGKLLPVKSHILSLSPFLDNNGVLRVGGRLRHATHLNWERRTPILLPSKHRLTELIVQSIHIVHLHSGLQLTQSIINETFWIVNSRDSIRRIIRKCFVCFRNRAATVTQKMGNLPVYRVTPAPAFQRCGMDYAGPFILRAIPGRRAAHMGGLWEAAVKSAKHHLTRVVGETRLTFEEITTLIAQIEACLNSRPLTPMSSDPNDLLALTPGHFLIGRPLAAIPEPDLMEIKSSHLSRWQHLQQMTRDFWKRWSNEHIQILQQRPKWAREQKNIKVGDLVLVKADNQPPTKWKLARVIQVHPGSDNKVRVVTIRTESSTMQRPIHKLALLPFCDELP